MNKEYWERFDKTKMEIFKHVYDEFWLIDWTKPKDAIIRLNLIHENLLKRWNGIKNRLIAQGVEQLEIRRHEGAFYEALFYYACLRMDAYFKICWDIVFQFASTILECRENDYSKREHLLKDLPALPKESPPIFGVIPLSDFVPPVLHRRVKGNYLKMWHLKPDFLIFLGEIEKRVLPPLFVDVKLSKPRLDEPTRKKFEEQANACRFFDSEMIVAYPRNDLPQRLSEWRIERACYSCGSLADPLDIECSKCRAEIGLPLFRCNSCRYEFKIERFIPLRLTCEKCGSESVAHLSAAAILANILRVAEQIRKQKKFCEKDYQIADYLI